MPTRIQRHRARGEDGAAMVEFAFVGLLFVLFLTGIISFGLILSFKQNLTQAAAEGARAGATAPAGDAISRAETAANNAVASFDRSCGDAGLDCTIVEHDCGEDPSAGLVDPDADACITVELDYNYDQYPLIPKFPILSALYPDRIASSSSSELNK